MRIASFADRLRERFWPPEFLQPLVAPGQTCLDFGCGMGFYTIPLARLVGVAGKVVGVDLQPKMLEGAARRAGCEGLADRISFFRPEESGWIGPQRYDFILLFWMLHEVPDQRSLLETLRKVLKPGGGILLVEPRLHVRERQWEQTLAAARAVGFQPEAGPSVAVSRSAILRPA